jgi:hypothetical protein
MCRIGGKCAGFRAKTVAISGHLPIPSTSQHNATLLYHIILFFTTTRKGRSGLAEHTNNPLRGMEFETVAKADFT